MPSAPDKTGGFVKKLSDGTYAVGYCDTYNFPAGLPKGTYSLTFDWYLDGNAFISETETYVFS